MGTGDLLGYGLKKLRESKGWKQLVISTECDVSQSVVSKWENTGVLPGEYYPCVLRALDVSLLDLRRASAEAMAGRQVQGREAVDLWRDAVALRGDLPTDVKLMLQMVPLFYDDGERFVQFKPRDVADAAGLEEDQAFSQWDEFLQSGFLEPIGPSGDLFELKFPEN